jgi:hypothetical protein
MHFKSAQIPSRVVFSSSGMECQLFAPKKMEQKVEGLSPKRMA